MNNIIILLDTGIDTKAFKNCLVGGKHFFVEGHSIYCDDNFDDDNGHGSACAYTIKSIFPTVKFYAIKILDKNAETIYPILETALEYCLDLEYRLINLSLAMIDNRVNGKFSKLCDKLKDKGKVLLSSVHNGHSESYPASYQSVIGIRGSRLITPEHYWYNSNKSIQCVADITPCFTDRSLEKYFLFGGNSKACALVCGLLMKATENNDSTVDFYSASSVLEKNAQRKLWTEKDINTSTAMLMEDDNFIYDDTVLNRIRQILCEIMNFNDINNLGWHDNLFENGLQPTMIKQLILTLEKHFGIDIPNSYINYNFLCSICMISKIIEGGKNEKKSKANI